MPDVLAALRTPWQDLGNLGAAKTIAAVLAAARGTLNQACAVTVTLGANETLDLMLVQDGTGSRQVTWTGVNVWVTSTGTAPTLAGQAPGALDRFYFESVAGVVYGYWQTEPVRIRTVNGYSAAGLLAESFAINDLVMSNLTGIPSGTMWESAIDINRGDRLAGIRFWTGNPGIGSPANVWATLMNGSGNRLVSTTDLTTTAPTTSFTAVNCPFAATYTTLTTGRYRIGIVIVASTMPGLLGVSVTSQAATGPPLVCGPGDTGLSTPASFDGVSGAAAGSVSRFYAAVY